MILLTIHTIRVYKVAEPFILSETGECLDYMYRTVGDLPTFEWTIVHTRKDLYIERHIILNL
jgi:hypothetical protein